jgi:hypothetical protein
MSLVTIAQQRESAWRDYALSPSYLADFVLSELCDLGVDKYVLKEIFSKSAIEALLAYSSKSINAYRAGHALSSFGSGGIATRPADEGRKLEMLLKSWAGKGWISISEIGGENSFNARLAEGAV